MAGMKEEMGKIEGWRDEGRDGGIEGCRKNRGMEG